MVKQRSKEFATYLLLGMKKTTLFFLFACEIVLIGIVCFAFDENDRERNAVFVGIFLPGRNVRPVPDKKICMEAGNQPADKGKASEPAAQ